MRFSLPTLIFAMLLGGPVCAGIALLVRLSYRDGLPSNHEAGVLVTCFIIGVVLALWRFE